MAQQNRNQKSVIGKGIEKECITCGSIFSTANPNEEECLGCKITREMKLPEGTIVNHNVLNIYMAGQFDREKGVDPTYLKVAEGVALLDRKRSGEQLCSRVKFFGQKSNNEIEQYVNMALNDSKYKKKYDALVFIKTTSVSDFMVFGISWSDRTMEKLADKDIRFIKNYAISVAVKWHFRDNA